jgi:coenzyme F420-0:L-glutamate ligase/coenzyme F420-1:gamma-L-glutamate ligase
LLSIIPLRGIPDVSKGDDLAELILGSMSKSGETLRRGDIIVISQKIVSKSEGRTLRLSKITPSAFAKKIAKESGKDPRHVEAVLQESKKIIRMKNGHLITESVQGFICANSGVDQSNVGSNNDLVTLLPKDSDASAERIRNDIGKLTGTKPAVIITDTFGRPWRVGQVNFAIGVAGMKPIHNYRGTKDMYQRVLNVTEIAVADELASAGELVMNKSDKVPVAIIRGYKAPRGHGYGLDLLRPEEFDLFR